MLVYTSFLLVIFAGRIQDGQCIGQGEVKQDADGRSGTISFKPPDLNDEEAQSQHMPQPFLCDACKILVYQLSEHLKKANEQHKSLGGKLSESIIIDTVETVCQYPFEDYGVKEVGGVKRLSGPGTEVADVPGIMQGGGKWPPRFHQLCESYVGEVGEEELYSAYQGGELEAVLCRDGGNRLLASCVREGNEGNREKKNKEKREKKNQEKMEKKEKEKEKKKGKAKKKVEL